MVEAAEEDGSSIEEGVYTCSGDISDDGTIDPSVISAAVSGSAASIGGANSAEDGALNLEHSLESQEVV